MRAARVASLVSLALALALAGATRASAHAGYDSSDPASGQVLEAAPTSLSITFSEAPDDELSSVKVLDAGGGEVAAGGNVQDGVPLERPGERTISLPLPDLTDGVYTVSWQTVSAVDSHITTGAFAFGVGTAVTGVPAPTVDVPETPGPSASSIAGKVALYLGLSLLTALGAVGATIFGGRLRAAPAVAMVAAVFAFGGALVMTVAERAVLTASSGSSLSMSDLLRSDAGTPYLRLLIAVAATAVGAVVAAARPRRWSLALVGAAAIATMFIRATGGHASASSNVQVLLQFTHFLAVGTWIGGLALLWLLVRERRPEPPAREAASFSALATTAVGVVVLSGSLRAIHEMGGIAALAHVFSTTYGTVLAVKVSVAVVLIGLGAINRFRSVRRLARREGAGTLRRVVGAELVTAVGVFALTGALTGLPPRGDDAPANVTSTPTPTPSGVTVTGADFATTVRATLSAFPGSAGPNDFQLTLTDYDSSSPFGADRVSLRFQPLGHPDVPTTTLDLASHGDAWHGSGTPLSLAGTWDVTAQVQRGADTTEIPLVLTTIVPGSTTSTSSPPGLPTITSVTMPDGRSAQVYADPGTAGPNQVHLTAFDDAGAELPLTDATFVAILPDDRPTVLDTVRFGPGHFVANTDLRAGEWMFDLTARARDGGLLQATVRQSIGAA
jgi:copper transport protein